MRRTRLFSFGALLLLACGGGQSDSTTTASHSGGSDTASATDPASESVGTGAAQDDSDNEFQIKPSETAGSAHGVSESKIKPSKTHAAMKFVVIDKRKEEPMAGIVISLEAPDGSKYYTDETDAVGYGEVLVPVGQEYKLVYLSLGRKDVTAKVKVTGEPNQNIKLTLRYKPRIPVTVAPPPEPTPENPEPTPPPPGFRLDGVTFDTNSAKLLPESFERLDSVVEYMTYKKSVRIEVTGHTDSVGNKKKNKKLSQERADACKTYLVGKGIAADRIEAIGFGDERPLASNDTEDGRAQNRRIEAREL